MDTLVSNLHEAHVLKEDLEDTTSLLVYQTGDTLDTTTTSETTNSLSPQHNEHEIVTRAYNTTYRFGDTLNVVTKDLTVTLGAALSETLQRKQWQLATLTRPQTN